MIDPLVHFLFVLGAYLLFCLAGRGSAVPLLTVLGLVFTLVFAPVAALWIMLLAGFAAVLFLLFRHRPRDNGWRQYGPYLILPGFLFVDLHPLGFGLNVETLAISFSTIRIFMTTKQLLQSRKAMEPGDARWIVVAAFWLPALMIGPVFSGTELRKQARDAQEQPVGLRDYRMVLQGLVLAILVNPGFGLLKDMVVSPEQLGAPDWTAAPLYFLQLFTAFWGQSLIAEHSSRFFGFRLSVNFDAPWKAADIREFWSRWHRSMADFVMQYIFLPLNLKGISPRVATVSAFLFMGLWHNLTWGYALWGAAHGALLGFWPKRAFSGASGVAIRIATWALIIGLSYIANFYGKAA